MKNRLTIRARVTLWYTLLTALIMIAALWAIFLGTKRSSDYYMENMLTEAVSAASNAVWVQDGVARLKDEDVPDFGDKVSFALLDAEGSLWQGHWPPFGADFIDGAVRRVRDKAGREYLLQDLLITQDGESVWLRGYLHADSLQFVQAEALLIARYALPLLLLLAAAGGYLLTLRAFRPVGRMARRAEGIAGGGDLALRFDAEGRDEIAMLAATFNGMFERLQSAFEREKRFTDDAAHELRTPVAVIRASCEQALASGREEDGREALRAVLEKSRDMTDMLAQMLALARMDAGRTVLTPEQINLSAVCRAVAQESADFAREKGVALTAGEDAPDGADIFCVGDELLLMRLAVLLTDNALKFTDAGGRVELLTTDAGDHVEMTVADTGIGMDEETAAHVFERFYQADAARTSGGGTGLGLSLALSITRLHGGEIALRSKKDEGSVFTVRLPKDGKK